MSTEENPYIRAISVLESSGIDYVIVGGFAVVMYGCNRFTPDLNVMVSFDDAAKLESFISAISETSFTATTDPDPTVLLKEENRNSLYDDGRRWFFSFRDAEAPSFSLDLFLSFPIPFEESLKTRKTLSADGFSFSICSFDDLVTMKKLADRGQDLADIEALHLIRKINEMKENSASDEEILALADGDAVKERIEGFLRFRELSPQARLEWLSEMLNNLAKFFMA